MTEGDKRKIISAEMDALRKLCGISRRDRISSEQIKEMTKVKR